MPVLKNMLVGSATIASTRSDFEQPLPDLGRAGFGGAVEQRRAVEDDAGAAAAFVGGAHLVREVAQEQHLAVADRWEAVAEPCIRA